jgi:predicted nuclease with RNAse H fold
VRTCGIDLASQPNRTAVAVIDWTATGAVVSDVRLGATDDELLTAIASADRTGIDAPIGWPDAFVDVLSAHHAGDSAHERRGFAEPGVSRFTRRLTDERVRERTGLVPLSVSADRIAYVALRAVRLLAQLEAGEGFDASRIDGTAVEAYPAAALKIWGLSHNRYKGVPRQTQLAALVTDLTGAAPWLDLTRHASLCTSNDDSFDAVVTALIARAAALGLTEPPERTEREIAGREGWVHMPTVPLAALDPRS